VLIVADDLTGACDAAAPFGLSTGLAISTESRDLEEPEIHRRMNTLATTAGQANLIFKKIDSTLRGNVQVEIAAAMQAFECPTAIVTPAFPDMGRTVRQGHLHIDGVRIKHAGANTLDAITNEDLDRIVDDGLKQTGRVLWAGSAGLAMALARRLYGTPTPLAPPAIKGPIVFCIGSDHPATQAQQAELERQCPAAKVLPVPRGKTAGNEIRKCLQGAAAIFITGGDTASTVLHAVGARSILVQDEVVAGVPWGMLQQGTLDGCPVVTKSGGFGPADTLVNVAGFFPASEAPSSFVPRPSGVEVIIPS
jgi:uncharacterized protein YgbK (DUF1537 family)